jgi:hypothetical protein
VLQIARSPRGKREGARKANDGNAVRGYSDANPRAIPQSTPLPAGAGARI